MLGSLRVDRGPNHTLVVKSIDKHGFDFFKGLDEKNVELFPRFPKSIR